jgi:hypothetical protein
MNHSDIRKHLKKGELAVEMLEKMGATFVENQKEHPHWVIPVKPIDGLKEQLEALIKAGIEQGVEAHMETLKASQKDDPRGPNWHLVEPMVGRNFEVRQENIPRFSKLANYGGSHFRGRLFSAEEIKYMRLKEYTGYAIFFEFAVHPYRKETVWLPLSCAAFRN